jgi:hypothetical protein
LWELVDAKMLALTPQASAFLEALQQGLLKPPQSHLVFPLAEKEGGDVFFFHFLAEICLSLDAFRPLFSSLLRASPLTRLFRCLPLEDEDAILLPHHEEGQPALSTQEALRLQQHPLMPLFARSLAEAWLDFPRFDMRSPVDTQLLRLNAWLATISRWLEVISQSGRLSLLSSFPRWWMFLLQSGYLRYIESLRGLSSLRLAEREALIMAYAASLQMGERFQAILDEKILQPGVFGWEDVAEARVFLEAAGRLWTQERLRERLQEAALRLRQGETNA